MRRSPATPGQGPAPRWGRRTPPDSAVSSRPASSPTAAKSFRALRAESRSRPGHVSAPLRRSPRSSPPSTSG
eukprot:9975191-Alexandrium_andersonii.AAC.1